MKLQTGDLVEYRMTGAVGVAVNKNVVVSSFDTFIGWVEVFDGQKTVAVPRYSLHPVGD